MITISSQTDLETYVGNAHPDFQGIQATRLVLAIRRAADCPAWGEDWEGWLTQRVGELREEAAAPPRVTAVELRRDGTAVVTHWRPNEQTRTTFVRPDGTLRDAGERRTQLDPSDQEHLRSAVARARECRPEDGASVSEYRDRTHVVYEYR